MILLFPAPISVLIISIQAKCISKTVDGSWSIYTRGGILTVCVLGMRKGSGEGRGVGGRWGGVVLPIKISYMGKMWKLNFTQHVTNLCDTSD